MPATRRRQRERCSRTGPFQSRPSVDGHFVGCGGPGPETGRRGARRMHDARERWREAEYTRRSDRGRARALAERLAIRGRGVWQEGSQHRLAIQQSYRPNPKPRTLLLTTKALHRRPRTRTRPTETDKKNNLLK